MSDLFARLPRCEKQFEPPVKDFDVSEKDDANQRRIKWNFRAMYIRCTPCTNESDGRDCPRCKASFLDAWNRPVGPWA